MDVCYHSDEPVIDDFIGHNLHVEAVKEMVESCTPPCVIGIHGDWGSGKTSFLCQLYKELTGNHPPVVKTDEKDKKPQRKAIWFDAWRYQFESNPVIALLNEIRTHFTLTQKFTGEAAKIGYAALMSLDELTKKIGFSLDKMQTAGEKWERETLSQPLPSQLCKVLLEDAIAKLLALENKGDKSKRLIIFIDDLDRCMGEVAFRFLEAIKIYLSLSNCIFILGLDVRHIRRAVAAGLDKSGMIPKDDKKDDKGFSSEIYAADYLNKMFQFIFYLPRISDYKPYLTQLMDEKIFKKEKQIYILTICHYKLLPPNPRKIKLFVNGLIFYLENLKKRLKPDETPDHALVLIFAYLKLMANDIYRMVESEKGTFWSTLLTTFCRSGDHNDNWALKKLILPEKLSDTPVETEIVYTSTFADPSDERLFRAAKLIREWNEGSAPTEDEFKRYLLQEKGED